MENELDGFAPKKMHPIALFDSTKYHQELKAKYSDVNAETLKINPDAVSVMEFSGYYAMNHSPGAFFTIDTNIHIRKGARDPIRDVTLILSIDGIASTRYAFTGAFDGTFLKQKAASGLDINIMFTRENKQKGIIASFSGHIKLPNKPLIAVSGSTYNTPIPYAMFIGRYYETKLVFQSLGEKELTKVEAFRIEEDYKLLYDFGTNGGNLMSIPSFTYNITAYFFTFSKGKQKSKLIMGTSVANGITCNAIHVNGKKRMSRSLLSIPFSEQVPLHTPNALNNELAKFCGYYPLPSIAPRAFLSIHSESIVHNSHQNQNVVMIGLSMDGIHSKGYYFEEQTMAFENNILTMPEQDITVLLKKEYNPQNRALASIKGLIYGHFVIEYMSFNSVPLTAFIGVLMTNTQNDSLMVKSKTEIIHNGKTQNNIRYIPTISLLTYPNEYATIGLWFVTDSLKGTSCIIRNSSDAPSAITVVNAIP